MAEEYRFKKRAEGPQFEQADELVLWAGDDGSMYTTDEDGTVVEIGAGGGGSLPESWEQTGDPANVTTNGGGLNIGGEPVGDVAANTLLVGSTSGANVEVQVNRVFVVAADSTIRARLSNLDADAPLRVRPADGVPAISVLADDGGIAAVDCDDLPIVSLGEPQDGNQAARLDSLPAMAEYQAGSIPDGVTADDALVSLGLLTNPAGGSTPGSVQTVAMEIQETAGAGTYTATAEIPAGAMVGAVWMYALDGPWDADTADLDIVDTDGNSYCDAQPLTTFLIGGPYTGLGTLAGDDDFLNIALSGPPDYKDAAWFAIDSNSAPGVPYAAGTTITATVVTTGAGGTTGHTRIVVMYYTAPTTTQAVKS